MTGESITTRKQERPRETALGAKLNGAWLTDIDDTLIDSGAFPEPHTLKTLETFVRRLSDHGVIWVGMSGVSLAKIRRRLLDTITKNLDAPILYYAGDGSQKYVFDPDSREWIEDPAFARTLSDAQAVAIMGPVRLEAALSRNGVDADESRMRVALASEAWKRWRAGVEGCVPPDGRSNSLRPLLEILEEKLALYGFPPKEAALYYRGGSISWMILGDHSAECYREPKAARAREQLISLARRELKVRRNLCELGAPVVLPFPGARGIKLVLEGNSKLRGVRELMKTAGLTPRRLIFAGNELYRGGNDNMLRAVKGMTLLSVGDRVDLGSGDVVDARFAFGERGRSDSESGHLAADPPSGGTACSPGVEAMEVWMAWVSQRLGGGVEWAVLLRAIRRGDRPPSKRV